MNSNWLTPSFFTSTSSRREVARGAAAMAAFAVLNRAGPAYAQSGQPVATKAIPHSGERIPVIGLGTANDFQKRVNGAERDKLKKVVDGLLAQGCKLIDTASSYGEAESVLGDLLSDQDRAKVFLATKIEDGSRKAGLAEFQRSLERLRYRQVDLLQLHNVQNRAAGPGAISRIGRGRASAAMSASPRPSKAIMRPPKPSFAGKSPTSSRSTIRWPTGRRKNVCCLRRAMRGRRC